MSNSRCGMRLPRPELLLVLLCLALPAAPARADTPPTTREQVDAEAMALRQLPTLIGSEKQRRLQFKPDNETARPPETAPAWVRWLGDFARWVGEAGRVFVWLLGALLLALLAVAARRWWQEGRGTAGPEALQLPTHVRNLDIRPETLPDDVGGAALALWQAGRQLEAMALLYRGALSQLVHRHQVAIIASSTEGDCLRLARPRLAGPAQDYFETLVTAWRRMLYGAQPPAEAEALWLCSGFASRLAREPGP